MCSNDTDTQIDSGINVSHKECFVYNTVRLTCSHTSSLSYFRLFSFVKML